MNTNLRHNTDKRVIRTKKAIRNSLFILMETKALDEISISELTAAANVNRRTFYTHYRSLTDILDEIEADLVQAMTDMLEGFDHNDYSKSVKTLFISFNKLVSTEFDTYFNLLKLDTRGILSSRLRNAIKASAENLFVSLPVGLSNKHVYVAAYMAGGFLALFSEWYYGDKKIPVEEAAELVGRMSEQCLTVIREIK